MPESSAQTYQPSLTHDAHIFEIGVVAVGRSRNPPPLSITPYVHQPASYRVRWTNVLINLPHRNTIHNRFSFCAQTHRRASVILAGFSDIPLIGFGCAIWHAFSTRCVSFPLDDKQNTLITRVEHICNHTHIYIDIYIPRKHPTHIRVYHPLPVPYRARLYVLRTVVWSECTV